MFVAAMVAAQSASYSGARSGVEDFEESEALVERGHSRLRLFDDPAWGKVGAQRFSRTDGENEKASDMPSPKRMSEDALLADCSQSCLNGAANYGVVIAAG
jgi:hypothetical protein